jgi:type I restriction enzyme S subunit
MGEWKETEFGLIASDWKFIPSTEFCLRVTDGTHDSPKEQKTGKHLITSKHIKGKDVDFDNAYLISEEDYVKINERSKVDQWDVIISMIGEYCGFSFVERNEIINYAVKNVGLFKTGDQHKAYWLYYFLNSKIGRFILETNKSGTSQPYLTLGFLRELPVLYPSSESEAKVIVEILSSLDDKIDLLHRQNKTLEQLAETLFRQWFVEEADESWVNTEIRNLTKKIQYGYTQSSTADKVGPKFLRITDIQGGKVTWDQVPYCEINNKDIEQYKLEASDIVIARTGASTGENVYLYEPDFSVFASYLIRLQFPSRPLARYVALHLHSNEYKGYIEGILSGSAQPNANAIQLTSFQIMIPPSDLLNKFYEVVTGLDKKKYINEIQIHTLTQLRDTLLPKLMSGEIRLNCDLCD